MAMLALIDFQIRAVLPVSGRSSSLGFFFGIKGHLPRTWQNLFFFHFLNDKRGTHLDAMQGKTAARSGPYLRN
jgi:hypothetical protein